MEVQLQILSPLTPASSISLLLLGYQTQKAASGSGSPGHSLACGHLTPVSAAITLLLSSFCVYLQISIFTQGQPSDQTGAPFSVTPS